MVQATSAGIPSREWAGPSFSLLLEDKYGRERFTLHWTRKPRKGRFLDELDFFASDLADIECLWEGASSKAVHLVSTVDLETILISHLSNSIFSWLLF